MIVYCCYVLKSFDYNVCIFLIMLCLFTLVLASSAHPRTNCLWNLVFQLNHAYFTSLYIHAYLWLASVTGDKWLYRLDTTKTVSVNPTYTILRFLIPFLPFRFFKYFLKHRFHHTQVPCSIKQHCYLVLRDTPVSGDFTIYEQLNSFFVENCLHNEAWGLCKNLSLESPFVCK